MAKLTHCDVCEGLVEIESKPLAVEVPGERLGVAGVETVRIGLTVTERHGSATATPIDLCTRCRWALFDTFVELLNARRTDAETGDTPRAGG